MLSSWALPAWNDCPFSFPTEFQEALRLYERLSQYARKKMKLTWVCCRNKWWMMVYYNYALYLHPYANGHRYSPRKAEFGVAMECADLDDLALEVEVEIAEGLN